MKNTMLVGVLAATLAAFSLSPAAHAQDAAPTTCKDGSTSQATGRGACRGHGGVARNGASGGAASTEPNPAGSSTASAPASGSLGSVACKDGSTSQSSGRGACSGHGGVQKGASGGGSSSTPGSASPTAPNNPGSSTASAPATGNVDSTTCKDGTTSQSSGRGACRGHGGVQKGSAGSSTAMSPGSSSSTAPNNPGSSTASASATGNVDSATCKDGTISQSSGRGACSGHGGVQKGKASSAATSSAADSSMAAAPAGQANTPAAATAAKTSTASRSAPTEEASNTDPTGATAKCKDGTYSKSTHHSGSCSHHGGVAEWLTGSH